MNIEKNVPIPDSKTKKPKRYMHRADVLFPLCKNLAVGDSVFLPDGDGLGSLLKFFGYFSYKAATEKRTEKGVKGVRVWRKQ